MNTFSNDNYAFIILDGYAIALINHVDNCIYIFYSHARNEYGMPDSNGTAVVMKCFDISTLHQYLRSLSIELNSEFFEIVPVQFVNKTRKSSIHQQMKTNNKRKVISENKRAKDRLYKKRKLSAETPAQRQTRLEKMRTKKIKN